MQIKNLKNQLPIAVFTALNALTQAGFEAYLVGGAVRDFLLGKKPQDYDITTNAHPEQVLQICYQHNWQTVDNLGRNFGCVMIIIDDMPLEITTFRGERYDDSDIHRPANTWYCKTLHEDLSRRDFTVNAMALDLQGKLYDFFNGYQDLQQKILRTVGKSNVRYQEDALRMFRACRFTAQLGFTYYQDNDDCGSFGMKGTPYSLRHSYRFPSHRCSNLSLERVRKEIDKLLLAPYAGHGLMLMMSTGLFNTKCRIRSNGKNIYIDFLPELQHLLGLPQNPRFHLYDVWEHTLLALDNSPKNLLIRWVLLLHDLGKGLPQIRKLNKEGQPTDPGHEAASAQLAKDILQRLQYPPAFIKMAVWLIAQHMRFAPMLITGEKTLLRWVRSEAVSGTFRNQKELTEAYKNLVEVFLADMGATHARENEKLMADGRSLGTQVITLAAQNMPVANSDLKISGHDLLDLVPQTEIKRVLPYLLERVQNGNLPNEHNALLAAIRKKLKRRNLKN